MNEIKALLEVNWVYVFFGLITLAVAYKYLLELIDWFLNRFGVTTKRALRKKEIEKRIEILERHDKWQYEAICKLSEKIDDLINAISANEEKERAKTVAMLRTQLYDMHNKFVTQGFVDNEGLKTFTELGYIYSSNGGNDVYHDKLKPEVLSLPIKNG